MQSTAHVLTPTPTGEGDRYVSTTLFALHSKVSTLHCPVRLPDASQLQCSPHTLVGSL